MQHLSPSFFQITQLLSTFNNYKQIVAIAFDTHKTPDFAENYSWAMVINTPSDFIEKVRKLFVQEFEFRVTILNNQDLTQAKLQVYLALLPLSYWRTRAAEILTFLREDLESYSRYNEEQLADLIHYNESLPCDAAIAKSRKIIYENKIAWDHTTQIEIPIMEGVLAIASEYFDIMRKMYGPLLDDYSKELAAAEEQFQMLKYQLLAEQEYFSDEATKLKLEYQSQLSTPQVAVLLFYLRESRLVSSVSDISLAETGKSLTGKSAKKLRILMGNKAIDSLFDESKNGREADDILTVCEKLEDLVSMIKDDLKTKGIIPEV